MNRATPKHQAPELSVRLLEETKWDIKDQNPENFTLIVFYRGLHCPLCEKYLKELQGLLPDFTEKGVEVIAMSMDSEKRARLSRKNWNLEKLKIGYDLNIHMAKNWGLFISQAVKEGEPEVFNEPGLFLVDNERKVYYSALNSNPWGRPYLPSFVKAVDYIITRGYPARGEVI